MLEAVSWEELGARDCLTSNKRPEELRYGKVVGTRDEWCPRAGKQIWAKPAFVARVGVRCGIHASETEVCVHTHELVLDAYLE